MNRLYSIMSNGKGAAAAGTFLVADRATAAAKARDYQIEIGLTGTTQQRPTFGDPDIGGIPPAGIFYVDTTIAKVIVSDGTGAWRDPVSGAVV